MTGWGTMWFAYSIVSWHRVAPAPRFCKEARNGSDGMGNRVVGFSTVRVAFSTGWSQSRRSRSVLLLQKKAHAGLARAEKELLKLAYTCEVTVGRTVNRRLASCPTLGGGGKILFSTPSGTYHFILYINSKI